jgi:hypothetical protein
MARRESISATRARLPAAVEEPFEVYCNGVRQTEGEDFEREGRRPRVPVAIAQEGRQGTPEPIGFHRIEGRDSPKKGPAMVPFLALLRGIRAARRQASNPRSGT